MLALAPVRVWAARKMVGASSRGECRSELRDAILGVGHVQDRELAHQIFAGGGAESFEALDDLGVEHVGITRVDEGVCGHGVTNATSLAQLVAECLVVQLDFFQVERRHSARVPAFALLSSRSQDAASR